ncbi:hypothetical protein CapIbe_001927 [Capra ibex]
MDGADVWAKTLAQLMAQAKPQDSWELVPQENLASGHLDSSGFQYRLRGLSRLQCGRCQWGWASAHVHVLFHLWWDEAGRHGLVKMRVWGQQCRLCLPGGAECRVSLLNVRLFLGKLVRFIAHKCYAEGPGSDQGPEVCFGERGEACAPGLCFFQQPPDPARGPEGRSTGSVKGRFALCSSGEEEPDPRRQAAAHAGPRAAGRPSAGCTPDAIAVPLYVADFIRSPIAEGRDFCGRAEEVITIPFSLGRRARGLAAEPAGGQRVAGRGSLHLPARSKATSKGRRFPVNIKTPVFHGKGLLLSGAKATTGFIYKGLGCVSEPDEDGDEGEGEVENADWGALSGSTRLVPVGGSPRPMTYIVGLMDSGEGSVTFPSSLADVLLEDADAFDLVYGSLTFPFMFAYEGRVVASSASGPEDKGQHHPKQEFRAQGQGPLRQRPGALGLVQEAEAARALGIQVLPPLPPGDEGFCFEPPKRPGSGSRCPGPGRLLARGLLLRPSEEAWVWVSLAVCILWIRHLCTLSPDRSPWV